MKVLAICRPRPGTDTSEMIKHIAKEAKTLEDWRDTAILLEAYSPGGPGAILILEVSDLGKAQSLLARLPLCEAGLIETELIGLRPLQY